MSGSFGEGERKRDGWINRTDRQQARRGSSKTLDGHGEILCLYGRNGAGMAEDGYLVWTALSSLSLGSLWFSLPSRAVCSLRSSFGIGPLPCPLETGCVQVGPVAPSTGGFGSSWQGLLVRTWWTALASADGKNKTAPMALTGSLVRLLLQVQLPRWGTRTLSPRTGVLPTCSLLLGRPNDKKECQETSPPPERSQRPSRLCQNRPMLVNFSLSISFVSRHSAPLSIRSQRTSMLKCCVDRKLPRVSA